jgi:hypothetical protein
MKLLKLVILTLFICLSSIGNSFADDKVIKVLFIGNSFTGASYLPTVLQEIALANGKKLKVKAEIKNGTSLYQHWDTGTAKQKISAEKWDYVVLQDSSASAFEHPEKTIEYGILFANLVTEQGAKPLLFNTWAYNGVPSWIENEQYADIREKFKKFVPNMFQKTNALYQQIADASKSDIVPVAHVWKKMKAINSSINLHAKDQSHPSPIGTYLTAIAFYNTLFDAAPKVLPSQLQTQLNQQKMTKMITININKTLSQQMLAAVDSVNL